MNQKISAVSEVEAANNDNRQARKSAKNKFQTDLDKRFEEYRAEAEADIRVKRATQFIRKALRGAFGRGR